MKKIFITIFSAAIILTSCSKTATQASGYAVDETYADLSVSDLHTKYYSSHRLQTIVDAPLADNYENTDQPYMEFPQGVKVVFWDSQMKEKSTLTSEYAVYYQKKKLWEARKNVVVTNEDGTTLKTEQLFGDEAANKIFSVKKVTVIESDGSVIEGKKGFESNMSFSNYKFLDVNGIVKLNEQYGNDLDVTQNNTQDQTN